MNIGNFFQNLVHYLTEGFARIFSPTVDEYPDNGVQPFESEPYQAKKSEL
jgi:regulator of sigma D